MVRLVARDDLRTTFLFKGLKECNEFKKFFEDRSCNIHWSEQQTGDTFPEYYNEYWKYHINEDPLCIAKKYLEWALEITAGNKDSSVDQKGMLKILNDLKIKHAELIVLSVLKDVQKSEKYNDDMLDERISALEGFSNSCIDKLNKCGIKTEEIEFIMMRIRNNLCNFMVYHCTDEHNKAVEREGCQL